MKKHLALNSVLYFMIYSISLSFAWFEYGINFPNVDGIGAAWIFPIVYLLLFVISLKFVLCGANSNSSYLALGISTISFISVCWGISALSKIGQNSFEVRDTVYPAILFCISLVVFAVYMNVYIKNKKCKRNRMKGELL